MAARRARGRRACRRHDPDWLRRCRNFQAAPNSDFDRRRDRSTRIPRHSERSPRMNQQDFSIIALVTHASFIVQLVMAGLLIASLASWTVIFGKLFGLRRTRAANDEFEREFWAGRNLNDLYADAGKQGGASPMERIFASGMREFFKLREKRVMDTGA